MTRRIETKILTTAEYPVTLKQSLKTGGYVVTQYYPWFKFYFPLFCLMVMYDNELTTKENKIQTKEKLNHNRYADTQSLRNRLSAYSLSRCVAGV